MSFLGPNKLNTMYYITRQHSARPVSVAGMACWRASVVNKSALCRREASRLASSRLTDLQELVRMAVANCFAFS